MYTVSNIVQDSTNISVLPKREQICTAINENTGETCGETESLQILDEFHKLYEARIKKVDSESANEFDRVSMKMKIMTEWIKDLGEQNIMLVNTVQDLEQTASDRVKILEEKLKQSSKVVSDKILLTNQSEEKLSVLSNRIRELEDDEKSLRQKIEFLWIDIKGLLELLKRAQTDNGWNLDGITFYYINPNDIPTPLNCVCAQVNTSVDDTINSKQVAELEDKEAYVYQSKFEEKNAELNKKLSKEERYVSDVQNCSNELIQKSQEDNHICVRSTSPPTNSDNTILVADIVESKYIDNGLEVKKLQEHLQDTESDITNMTHLQLQLKKKDKEIEEIKSQMNCIKKESMETHESLAIEITKKHNLIMFLSQEIRKLEEQYRYANMQIHFKDDIIKKMRKKQIELKNIYSSLKDQIDADAYIMDTESLSNSSNSYQKIFMCFSKTNLLLQKEEEKLDDLKTELKKIVRHLKQKNVETSEHNFTTAYKNIQNIKTILNISKTSKDDRSQTEENLQPFVANIEVQLNCVHDALQNEKLRHDTDKSVDTWMYDTTEKLMKNIENISRICKEKKKAIEFMEYAVCISFYAYNTNFL
ncbi:myosin-11-like isoform X1 [Vespula maculifrons]|uniref:Myosin-11-like isoform X1 n=1 Tax=Vespula maculifrons TaxID=7453 RepID=A0ABD2AMB7_VESMC